MVKKTLLALAILAMTVGVVSAKPLTLYEIQEATCQILTKGGRAQGTATCANEDANDYLFVTNAHVVGSSTQVEIIPFSGGYKGKSLNGQVAWRTYRSRSLEDLAIVRVRKTEF